MGLFPLSIPRHDDSHRTRWDTGTARTSLGTSIAPRESHIPVRPAPGHIRGAIPTGLRTTPRRLMIAEVLAACATAGAGLSWLSAPPAAALTTVLGGVLLVRHGGPLVRDLIVAVSVFAAIPLLFIPALNSRYSEDWTMAIMAAILALPLLIRLASLGLRRGSRLDLLDPLIVGFAPFTLFFGFALLARAVGA